MFLFPYVLGAELKAYGQGNPPAPPHGVMFIHNKKRNMHMHSQRSSESLEVDGCRERRSNMEYPQTVKSANGDVSYIAVVSYGEMGYLETAKRQSSSLFCLVVQAAATSRLSGTSNTH